MNRYPGIQPFSTDQSHLFFGRQKEARDLYRLIAINNVVVLFGNTGTGKTSLLQAGIHPYLEKRLIHPVFIRFNNTNRLPEEQIFDYLYEHEYIAPANDKELSLSKCFDLFSYYYAGEEYSPLFIFDQFEELFTLYSAEQRKGFVQQLASIINRRTLSVGTEITDTLRPVHIVISIRSDYLFYLDRLSNEIPGILRCVYELSSMSEVGAKEAMSLPAQLPGMFDSQPFSFAPETLDHILQELSKDNQEGNLYIEAFQLQMFCQRIEEKCIEMSTPDGFVVVDNFYGGVAGIATMLNDYYSDVINAVPSAMQMNVKQFIEQGLVSNDRRIILEKEYIKNEYNITDEVFELLTGWRLIKKEPRRGMTYFEISHDTLLSPIITAKTNRLYREELVQLEQQQLQKEQEMILERAKRRRATVAAILGTTMALIATFAGIIAFLAWQKSNEAYKVAETERRRTQEALEVVLEKERQKNALEASKYVEDARNFIESGFKDAARDYLRMAQKLDSSSQNQQKIRQLLEKIDQ